MNLINLPLELLLYIAAYLDICSLVRLRLVSKQFKAIANSSLKTLDMPKPLNPIFAHDSGKEYFKVCTYSSIKTRYLSDYPNRKLFYRTICCEDPSFRNYVSSIHPNFTITEINHKKYMVDCRLSYSNSGMLSNKSELKKIIMNCNLFLVFATDADDFIKIMQGLKSELITLNYDQYFRCNIVFIKLQYNLDNFSELEFILNQNKIQIAEFLEDDFCRDELLQFLEVQHGIYASELVIFNDIEKYIGLPKESFELKTPRTNELVYCPIL